MTREQKKQVLRQACVFWPVLDQKTQADLIDGKCIYSEYEGTPIIDYTRQHPIFSVAAQ